MASRTGDRAPSGRLSFEGLNVELLVGVTVSTLLVVVTRVPFVTHYLLNWDAVQFALGMRHFDIVHHQPHPPGYLGYVALGRLVQLWLPDPNAALVAISIAGECCAAAFIFWFAFRVFGTFAAWVSALALVFSPLFWYYGEAANTYALEPFLSLLIAWFCWRAWTGDRQAVYPAAVTIGVVGALRPSTAFLLAPLFLVALWRLHSRPAGAAGVGLAALATLTWVVPLLALSGGPRRYLDASLQLGSSVSTSTALWERGLEGLQTTTDAVMRGVGWELGLFAVFLMAGALFIPLFRWRRLPMPDGWWLFCCVWMLPAVLTFLLVHIGQVVYVQVFIGALFLMLGPALQATVRAAGRASTAPVLVALALAFDVFTFFVPAPYSLRAQLHVHDVQAAQTIGFLGSAEPGSTVLLTDASGPSSYRLAQFYLPGFHRLAVGTDRHGWLGEIYADSYDLERFRAAIPLAPPPGVTTFVFLDPAVVKKYVADPERLKVFHLSYGGRIYTWIGPTPTLHHGELWLGSQYRERRGLS